MKPECSWYNKHFLGYKEICIKKSYFGSNNFFNKIVLITNLDNIVDHTNNVFQSFLVLVQHSDKFLHHNCYMIEKSAASTFEILINCRKLWNMDRKSYLKTNLEREVRFFVKEKTYLSFFNHFLMFQFIIKSCMYEEIISKQMFFFCIWSGK